MRSAHVAISSRLVRPAEATCLHNLMGKVHSHTCLKRAVPCRPLMKANMSDGVMAPSDPSSKFFLFSARQKAI